MNQQELNKKLAEWAGIRYEPDQDEFKVIFPDGSWYNFGHDWEMDKIEPDFTNSLDACFKWLVPKLIKGADHSIIITQDLARCTGYVRPLQFGKQYDATDNHSPSLALCLAIEKLIDSEVASAVRES